MFDELKARFRNCLGTPKNRSACAIGVESYLYRCKKSMSPCASSFSSFSRQWQRSSCRPPSSPRELSGVSTLNPAQDPKLLPLAGALEAGFFSAAAFGGILVDGWS
jgi:hypothetical protein